METSIQLLTLQQLNEVICLQAAAVVVIICRIYDITVGTKTTTWKFHHRIIKFKYVLRHLHASLQPWIHNSQNCKLDFVDNRRISGDMHGELIQVCTYMLHIHVHVHVATCESGRFCLLRSYEEDSYMRASFENVRLTCTHPQWRLCAGVLLKLRVIPQWVLKMTSILNLMSFVQKECHLYWRVMTTYTYWRGDVLWWLA